MARAARTIVNNACYHVINRGNHKERIFRHDDDFKVYINLIKRYKRKYGFLLYAYCLMPNHVHLVIKPSQSKLISKIMQGITLSYTLWFNYKYKIVGRLWQSRYKSMIIQQDQYFSDCLYYVEANPVRAKLTNTPIDYEWSSYKERYLNDSNKIIDSLRGQV